MMVRATTRKPVSAASSVAETAGCCRDVSVTELLIEAESQSD
jgi:hypothetical protein